MQDMKATTAESRRPRPGGRTGELRRRAVEAAKQLIAEGGYPAVTFQAVSDRSGVDRSTIYRKWRTRGELAVEAVLTITSEINPVPDTGTLAGDVLALLEANASLVKSPVGIILLTAGLLEGDKGEMAVKRQFWQARGICSRPCSKSR